MYHQPSKRKILIQRTAIYALMTIATVGLVVVLVFVMLGYQYNGNDGKIEQGGLVQFDSRPTGADVTIDGGRFGTRTTSKTTMSSGRHFITMERAQYRKWQKSVTVVPGEVLWLNYTRLIPNDLKSASVADFPAVTGALASDDNKWLAVKEEATSPTIKLIDLTREDISTKVLTLPQTSYSPTSEGKTQSFTFESWDPDSRYLLVEHMYENDKREWLVVDTQNVTETRNVTKILDVDMSRIMFSNNNSAILFAQIGHDVRKIDLGAATLSRPLVTNVADFSLYGDSMVTFSTLLDPDTKTRSVGYYIDGTASSHVIRSYADAGTSPLLLTVGRYFGETFESIVYGDSLEILKGDLSRNDHAKPTLEQVATTSVMGGARYLSNMTNGRFVVAQNSSVVTVYDLELKKTTETVLKSAVDAPRKVSWLDDYMMWSDYDGVLHTYEFDGMNQQDIMQVTPGLTVTLSPSGKYLYGFQRAADGAYHLARIQLVL
jgi:PEGA domain-containing protein